MDADVSFALAVLRKEYADRRKFLLESATTVQRDNVLTDLEAIHAGILKIEFYFGEHPEEGIQGAKG